MLSNELYLVTLVLFSIFMYNNLFYTLHTAKPSLAHRLAFLVFFSFLFKVSQGKRVSRFLSVERASCGSREAESSANREKLVVLLAHCAALKGVSLFGMVYLSV